MLNLGAESAIQALMAGKLIFKNCIFNALANDDL